MTIRETTIAKLQQLSEPLLQEIADFIDFVIHKHQTQIVENKIKYASKKSLNKQIPDFFCNLANFL